jgi:hypothetical protein
MKVIGLSSQMRMGKDTIADYLKKDFPDWERSSLAKNVKQIFCDAFNVNVDFIEEWKSNPDPPPGFLKNVRQSLQFIGDGFRQIKSSVWMDLAFQDDKKIFSDVRYINELQKVKEVGGINILVWRPGFDNDDPNGSEAQIRPVLDYFKRKNFEGSTDVMCLNMSDAVPDGVQYVDYFIKNNGTIEQLYHKIDTQLVPYLKAIFND